MSDTTSEAVTRVVNGIEVPAPGVYAFDPAHTQVGFVVRHMMVAKVRGRFTKFDGRVVIAEDPTESSLEVSIEAESIDTREETRDNHLRSADFFDVEKFPNLTYTSTKVAHLGENRWRVQGGLTIHGVTRSVPLDLEFEGGAKDPYGNIKIGFSAEGEIDREDFGLQWNVALETGGWMVGKTVKLEIEAELIKQS